MFRNFKHLLLLAMKPVFRQQLSRRVGPRCYHITKPTFGKSEGTCRRIRKGNINSTEKESMQANITTWQSPSIISRCRLSHSKFAAEPHGRFTNRYRDTYIPPSRVKRAKQSNVPGPLRFFVGSVHLALLRLLDRKSVV